MTTEEPAVLADGLVKHFKGKPALDGLDLHVTRGTVHGLLGPNGAGKTTAVRVLATLLRPDGGRAYVAGRDVARDPRGVRRHIGMVGQYAAVDEILSGRQNLEMFGRLFHLGGRAAVARAGELLRQFRLEDAAEQSVKTYSGGMRRRLDLAAGMLLAPDVLFLDEPTTGLDPRSRNEVWEEVRKLVAGGTTIVLTTQYLDEADRLADRICLIEHGRRVADGSPAELKQHVGGDRLQVVVRDAADLEAARQAVAAVASAGSEPEVDAQGCRVAGPVDDGVAALTAVARALHDKGVALDDIGLRRPTLDDVFLRLTGRPATPADDQDRASAPRAPVVTAERAA